MRFYKLTPEERAKIEALNKGRKNTLLIICDHGDGNIGVEADDIESSPYLEYFSELGGLLEPTRIIALDLEAV